MLVVADDLGSWPQKTDAIIDALERDLVTAAGIMANFEDFERACSLLEAKGLRSRVGAHLVLTDGAPLTEAMRRSRRFCDSDGRFVGEHATWPLLHLDSHERRLVKSELQAQIEAMRRNGLPVAHLDSHEHVHVQPAIARIVIALALELDVPRVRSAPNLRSHPTRRYQLYGRLLNRWISRRGLATTRYVGSVTDYLGLAPERRPSSDLELYLHPILVDGRLEDDDAAGEALEQRLGQIYPAHRG